MMHDRWPKSNVVLFMYGRQVHSLKDLLPEVIKPYLVKGPKGRFLVVAKYL